MYDILIISLLILNLDILTRYHINFLAYTCKTSANNEEYNNSELKYTDCHYVLNQQHFCPAALL